MNPSLPKHTLRSLPFLIRDPLFFPPLFYLYSQAFFSSAGMTQRFFAFLSPPFATRINDEETGVLSVFFLLPFPFVFDPVNSSRSRRRQPCSLCFPLRPGSCDARVARYGGRGDQLVFFSRLFPLKGSGFRNYVFFPPFRVIFFCSG